MKIKKCPSCRAKLGKRHAASHAKYVAAHRRAARNYQKRKHQQGFCATCGTRKITYAGYRCDRCGLRRKYAGIKHPRGSRLEKI